MGTPNGELRTEITNEMVKLGPINEVGRCRLPVSNPELNVRLLSALETKM